MIAEPTSDDDLIVGEGRNEDDGQRTLFVAADEECCEQITAPSGQSLQAIFLTEDHALWLIAALIRQLPADLRDELGAQAKLPTRADRAKDN